MHEVLLVIHLLLAVSIVILVLLQRSEGGALGIGGSGGAGGGLMTGRSAANLLTRTTAILAACFMLTSIGLTILANRSSDRGSILDQPLPANSSAPANQLPAPRGPQVPTSD
ncbi:MAG: preprotein translocase subunit SecG [Alphaproteobacteria bacterium]